MGYYNCEKRLPKELIEAIQQYVDGESIYIPRIKQKRISWGEVSQSRTLLDKRNVEIYERYHLGIPVKELAEEYNISTQGIYKIISKIKSK